MAHKFHNIRNQYKMTNISNIITQTLAHQQINQKRHQFYCQIKQKSKQKLMNLIRCQYLKQERDEIISEIVKNTGQSINQYQVQNLIYFASKNVSNALIHIGNLFIDQILDHRVFEIFGIDWLKNLDTNSGYFEWLVVVLLQKRFIDTQLQIYIKMTRQIIQSKTHNQFRILNFLKCINYLLKKFKEQFQNVILFNQELHLLQYIISHCTSKSLQISKQAWRIVNNLFNQQTDQLSLKLICMCDLECFLSLLQKGLMSVSSQIRTLACQILTNNISVVMHEIHAGYIPFLQLQNKIISIIKKCLNLAISQKQKQSVKVQLSYALINYLQSCSFVQASCLIISEGLAKIISQFRQNNDCNIQINKNCDAICCILTNLCFKKEPQNENQILLVNRMYIQLKHHKILMQTSIQEYQQTN